MSRDDIISAMHQQGIPIESLAEVEELFFFVNDVDNRECFDKLMQLIALKFPDGRKL